MRALIAALAVGALGVPAAARGGVPPVGIEFDRGELAGWTVLALQDVTPFHRDGLRSELVFGALSSSGSYAFVTVIDNGLERPAAGADGIAGFLSEDVFADLVPEGFASAAVTVAVPGKRLDAVALSFRTRKLPYEVGAGDQPAVVKAVFLPVVLREIGAGYRNLIVVANFRGTAGDLPAFDRMCRRVVLLESRFAVVEPAEFNAIRDRLAADAPQQMANGEETAPAPGEGRTDESPEQLGAAVAHLMRGVVSPTEQRLLDSYAHAHEGTPLADSIAELSRRERIRFEVRVWQVLTQEIGSDRHGGLAALLLGESIALADLETAVSIAETAHASGLSIASLDCPELERLLEAVVRWSGGSPTSERALVRFFSLEDAPLRCRSLERWFKSRGVPIENLEEVAIRVRGGRWRFPGGIDDPPRWAWHAGKLVALRPVGDPRRRLFVPESASNLLAVVEDSISVSRPP